MYFRSLKHIGLAFFCVVLITGFVSAQETLISEDEYRLKMGGAMAATMSRDYRLTTEVITYDTRSPQSIDSKLTFIYENIGNRENRRTRNVSFSSLKHSGGQKEVIAIGNDIYSRNGDATWVKSQREEKKAEQQTAVNQTKSKTQNITQPTYAYLGKEEVGGMMADVYRITKSWEITTDKNIKIPASFVERSWLSPDGMLLKTEIESFDGEGNKKTTTIRTYEHPERLKIEAPIK